MLFINVYIHVESHEFQVPTITRTFSQITKGTKPQTCMPTKLSDLWFLNIFL